MFVAVEQKQKPNKADSNEALKTGIPILDWGLRINRAENGTDAGSRAEIEEAKKKYWAMVQLAGLYE